MSVDEGFQDAAVHAMDDVAAHAGCATVDVEDGADPDGAVDVTGGGARIDVQGDVVDKNTGDSAGDVPGESHLPAAAEFGGAAADVDVADGDVVAAGVVVQRRIAGKLSGRQVQ